MSSPPPPGFAARLRAFDYSLGPLQRPVNYLQRGLLAASFPLRGIWYFMRRPYFFPLFLSRLLPLSILSFLVYFILFTFAFLPQLALLAIWQGRSAWLNAIVLVLGEGLVVIQGIFEGFFVDETRVDVFDATLLDCHLAALLAPQRILFPDAADPVRQLGKPTSSAVYTPWSCKQITELIVFLPLNFIPWVGTPAFIIITGTRLGKLAFHRWFQLRGLSRADRKAELRRRGWECAWFGTVAMLFELIPVLSFFFLLTTTAGAALWVARLEEEEGATVADRAERAEPQPGPDTPHVPPPYEDDPVEV